MVSKKQNVYIGSTVAMGPFLPAANKMQRH